MCTFFGSDAYVVQKNKAVHYHYPGNLYPTFPEIEGRGDLRDECRPLCGSVLTMLTPLNLIMYVIHDYSHGVLVLSFPTRHIECLVVLSELSSHTKGIQYGQEICLKV